jgi:hypothetical protein
MLKDITGSSIHMKQDHMYYFITSLLVESKTEKMWHANKKNTNKIFFPPPGPIY